MRHEVLDLFTVHAFRVHCGVIQRPAARHVLRREVRDAEFFLGERVDNVARLFGINATRIKPARGAVFGRVHEPVISGQQGEYVVAAHLRINRRKKFGQRTIKADQMIHRLNALWAEVVIDVVVTGKAHRQNVGRAFGILANGFAFK